jgi:hypothetical protein
MVQYALEGAVAAYAINNENISYQIKNSVLNKQIESILSDKNAVVHLDNATGGYQAAKSFTLVPLYSYYITVYGLPAYGVGFDPNKLALINNILLANNINPYR